MAPSKEKTIAFQETFELLSKKWTLFILKSFCTCSKPMRFSELEQSIEGINANVLSQRLNELEEAGLISRTVKDTKPIQIEYNATKKAAELKKVFRELDSWSQKWS